MRWKPKLKPILILVIIVELVALSYPVLSWLFPSNTTITLNVGSRFNPTQALSTDSKNIYTIQATQIVNNVSFPNRALRIDKGGKQLWINVTSGSNVNIGIWQWYTSNTFAFEYATGATCNTTLYTEDYGQPTSVTGALDYGYNEATHKLWFTVSPTLSTYVYVLYTSYSFTFRGAYNETTGLRIYSNTTVTAHYTDGTLPNTFKVNGTYVYSSTHKPEYFNILLPSGKTRQYWLGETETSGTITVFDDSLTTYYIVFLDLAGVLPDKPFIYAEYYINGSLYIVDKRKVDVETKLTMQLVTNRRYVLNIIDGSSYTFGELLTTGTTTITLTLRGIDFPKETLLTYKYVRIYGLRAFATPTGSITIIYQDTLNMTTSVTVTISYRNGTVAYTAIETTNAFMIHWLNAANNTDYQVTATIIHQRYGTYSWKQYYPRTYTTNPWESLGFLGTFANIDPKNFIGIFIILVVGAGFSMINPEVGAFLAACTAAILTYMGWLPLAPGALIAAFCFSIMFGIVAARRRVQTY